MNQLDTLLADNPFPGLRPFEQADAERFFGRDTHIAELAQRLETVNFMAVTGDSGCGKSSLVRAGLLSCLQRHAGEEGGARWQCAVMRPGRHPIAALAQAMTPLLDPPSEPGPPDPLDESLLNARLNIGDRGLIDAVALAGLGPGQRVLIVVDQFEEVFRYDIVREEASAFVKLLLAVAQDPESPVSVVITMRTDALGLCADHQGLPEAVSRGQYLVPRLTRAQRKQAIEGPVEMRGQHMDAALLQRLLNDVSNAFDDLPILQHVLARTWVMWARRVCGDGHPAGQDASIRLEDYVAAGTSAHALSNHGKEACDELQAHDAVIGRVFRALTERVADTGGRGRSAEGLERRRPLALDRLRAVVGAPPEVVDQVIERFRRADTGFLAAGPALIDGSQTIDIAHESLIRQWDRMRTWLTEEAKAVKDLRWLVQMAEKHRDEDGPLLQRKSVALALKSEKVQRPNVAWVGLCLNQNNAEAGDTFALLNNYVRTSRWRGRLAIASLCLLPLLLIPFLYAVWSVNRTFAQELASRAQSLRGRLPAQAALVAVKALEINGDNKSATATLRSALLDLEQVHIERVVPRDTGMQAMRASPDRSLVLAFGDKTLQVLDVATLQPAPGTSPMSRAGRITDASITGDRQVVVTQTEGNAWQVQRVGQPEVVKLACPGEGNAVFTHAVAQTGHAVAIGCYRGDVLVGEPDGGVFKVSHHFRHQGLQDRTATALAFAQDDQLLASGDAGGLVNVWRLDQPEPADGRAWIGQAQPGDMGSVLKQGDAVVRLRFHPVSPSLLISASDDGTATKWQLDVPGRRLSGQDGKSGWLFKHDRPVSEAVFAPHPERDPVITVDGKNVHVWSDEQRKVDLSGHEDWVTGVQTSADGKLLATASSDGTARIWSVDTGLTVAVLRGHLGAVTHAQFLGQESERVLTIGADGQVFVWRLKPIERVAYAHRKWAFGAAFSPDARHIAVGLESGSSVITSSAEGDAAPGHSVPIKLDEGSGLGKISWSRDGRAFLGTVLHAKQFQIRELRVFDASSGARLWPRQKAGLFLGAFAQQRDELLSSDREGRLEIWDSHQLQGDEPRPIASFAGAGGDTTAIAISPDGQWVAASAGRSIMLWPRGQPQAKPRELRGHEGSVTDLVFSQDGRFLLSGSADRSARIWPVGDGLTLGEGTPTVLQGNTSQVTSVAFDATGRRVLTGNVRGTIDVWRFDPQERSQEDRAERLVTLRWHNEGVNAVSFSPDGETILSASDDGSVRRGKCLPCWMSPDGLRAAAMQKARVSSEEQKEIERQPKGTFSRALDTLRWPKSLF